jgi:diaminohydroxyphosphoribosylaminopyrimidine deaminase/5-amino-6-(5-phosphoribosylamino)uracil reductase
MAARSPVRVVLDRALRIPGASKLVLSARQTPLWLIAAATAEAAAAARLGAAGAQVLRLPVKDAARGLGLAAVLKLLAERGVTRLMVEGGAQVASAFVTQNLVDEIWLFRGSQAIGDDGIPALQALPLTSITASPAYRVRDSETLSPDTLTIYERT